VDSCWGEGCPHPRGCRPARRDARRLHSQRNGVLLPPILVSIRQQRCGYSTPFPRHRVCRHWALCRHLYRFSGPWRGHRPPGGRPLQVGRPPPSTSLSNNSVAPLHVCSHESLSLWRRSRFFYSGSSQPAAPAGYASGSDLHAESEAAAEDGGDKADAGEQGSSIFEVGLAVCFAYSRCGPRAPHPHNPAARRGPDHR
jgi:hypothetical protein